MRVYKWALELLKSERADEDILLMAVLFHDIGYTIAPENHPQSSAEICRKYLADNHFEEEYIDTVCRIIQNHDNKELLHLPDTSIEQILMIEADNLDESGALSILRDTLAIGAELNSSYKAAYERIGKHPVTEQKIMKFSVTSTARKIWKQKQIEYSNFLSALQHDLV